MPIDYSRWKDIEVSDDEDDTHPNVDTPSLFRWRHEARLERMKKAAKAKEEVSDNLSTFEKKLAEIRQKLENTNLDGKQRQELETELTEIEMQEQQWRAKEAELARQERLTPWNVDTISHDGFSRTRINKIQPQSSSDDNLTEDEKNRRAQEFMIENSKLIDQYGLLSRNDDTKQFLLQHPHLCCDDTCNYLILRCLELEMQGHHDLMEHMAHQSVIMNYLIELAKQLKVNPQAPQLISSFFSKIKMAEQSEYIEMFQDELRSFKQRIVDRAKVKLEEARKESLGPGGLDPTEVFETLPPEMKECFANRDIESLKKVAMSMPGKEFEYHLQRCIDSGLWVPGDDNGNDDGEVPGPSTSKQPPTPQ
ncbi:Hsp90 co-chaperone Cdc37 [Trichinella spiralis]|uniref:Hsp90 co-chaperone Cdc37 n=3 Tax=Trichinella spiralis TaxID=6334 RepID=A0ABR3KZ16_TRISP|nr:Hsp90 co-chaperone Cdc37 [Trichinella spiralis]